ncbi:MAG: serine/threonine protein kinase [Verrucomicrobia bacterium]|nr:serine/threonine protein kinase [Verrucomicrobiota bacterium]
MSAESRTAPAGARERDIFLEALEKTDPSERAAFLANACGGDHALSRQVEALLREQAAMGAFLETPAVSGAQAVSPAAAEPTGTVPCLSLTEKPGDRIGRYKLLQKIGEGGCGVVYMADQEEPVRRRVALKIIKLGMDTKSVIARFEAERQALALMDHSNIAKVLDAGTTDAGRPFFVMELVRGIKITEYSDQNNLSNEERLNLFIRVCHAIQHAHQKGIIHRDIKPSNILVTLHDGVPVPKVIDFGIAKAMEQRLTDKTLFTEFQAFIGTPAYTSPEQAEMSGLDIDTRSDIYALGVLLYELLTGQTPFDPEQLLRSGLDEMRRIIREEEPMRPSTRLSTMGMAEAITLTKARQAKIPALAQAVRGDLDWIVMKCLEKDRTRRYETANGLAMDIQRYLNYEPVLARPPSTAYRIQKFVRRNKVIVAASATVTVVLLAAVVVSAWMAIRATQAEHEQSYLHKTAEAALKNEARQRQRAVTEQLAALRRSYNSDMNLVQQALAANNYGRVVDLLDRHRPEKKVVSGQWPVVSSQSSVASNQLPVVSNQRPAADNRRNNTSPLTTDHWPLTTDLRQWEWRYFWNQSRSDAAFTLPTQSNSIEAVAISPNGRLLATRDRQGLLKLWDLTTRTEVAVLRERGGFGEQAFAFSHEGGHLAAVVPGDGPRRRSFVKVWTVATRQVTAEIPHEGGVELLAFSPDDTQLLLLGQDMAVRVWDLDQQRLTLRCRGPRVEGWLKPSAFSPDRKSLAIGDSGKIRVLDLETGNERSSAEAPEGDIAAIAFSPDGELLAASPLFTGTSTTIKLFSVSTGKEVGQLIGHVSWIPGLTFTPDGKRLLSAGADQTIRIWDVAARRELGVMRGHLSEVTCVAITPDAKTIVSGCKDGTLFGWAGETTEGKKPFETLPIPVARIEFFPDGKRMMSVNSDGTVSLWESATLEEVERLSALGNEVTQVVVSPDGSRLYAATGGSEIKVLDWATRLVITNVGGVPGRRFPMGPGGRFGPGSPPGGPGGPRGRGGPGGPGGPGFRGGLIPLLGLVDNGRTLVAAGPGSTIRLLDTISWQLKAEWKSAETGPFRPAKILSPDGHSLLAAAGMGGPIEFRNLADGQTEGTVAAQNRGVTGLAFSPNGNLLATASSDGTVNLWDSSERELVDVLRGHLLGVHAVAFSSDGQRLATGSHGNEAVKLWDVSTRHEVATLAGEGSIFSYVKFSPDGHLLVAINEQGMAHFWRAPSLGDIAAREARAP